MRSIFNIIVTALISFVTSSSKYQCMTFNTIVTSNPIVNSSKRYRREIVEFSTKSSSSIINLKHESPEFVLRTISRTDRNNVEQLYLESNGLTNLPRTLVASTKIESISLADNKITDVNDVRVINGFSRLRKLVLSRNPLRSLRGLNTISLEDLEANDCEISEIDDIFPDCLPSLKKLNLTGNPLGTIRKLMSSTLAELVLKDCRLSHLYVEAFCGLTNLTRLDLRGNELMTMPDAIFLGNRNLRYLNLGENRLTNVAKSWFNDTENLEILDLSKNSIRTIDETDFAGLAALTRLDLAGNEVTYLPNLDTAAVEVNFSKNSLTNNATWDLTRMTRVRRLDLSRNRLFGNCGAFRSTSLNILILGNNRLDKLTRESIRHLPNLTDVDLRGNKISSGINPEIFADNPNVANVELDDNPWSCNCTKLYPMYYYLASGQRTKTTSLICQSPKNATGRTWWEYCGKNWRKLMIVDNYVERGNRWIVVISAAFGSSVIFGTMIYVAYTFTKNRRFQSTDATN